MGYEIAGGLGVKMAAPDREVYVLVGDGSYLMMAQEIVTAVQEGIKLTDRPARQPRLREHRRAVGVGRQRRLRHALPRIATPATGELDGDALPVDLAANAASLGARVCARRHARRASARRCAAAQRRPRRRVIVVPVDREARVGGYESWWDVPVAEVSTIRDGAATRARRTRRARRKERDFL